jgi:hypothetical protein
VSRGRPAAFSNGFQYVTCKVAQWMLMSFTGDWNIHVSPAWAFI